MPAAREALSSERDPVRQTAQLQSLGRLDVMLEAAGGGDREHEAKSILSGLGFKQERLSPANEREFSGGWVMRAGLARLLFKSPALLLLDEPTNHLDLDANLWFEKYLASFRGAVIVTSHDRAFLNQVATRVLAIEEDDVVLMKGGYDEYLVAREQLLKVKQAAAARQEREIQRQMRFVGAFPVQGNEGHTGAESPEATWRRFRRSSCQERPRESAIRFRSRRAVAPRSFR